MTTDEVNARVTIDLGVDNQDILADFRIQGILAGQCIHPAIEYDVGRDELAHQVQRV